MVWADLQQSFGSDECGPKHRICVFIWMRVSHMNGKDFVSLIGTHKPRPMPHHLACTANLVFHASLSTFMCIFANVKFSQYCIVYGNKCICIFWHLECLGPRQRQKTVEERCRQPLWLPSCISWSFYVFWSQEALAGSHFGLECLYIHWLILRLVYIGYLGFIAQYGGRVS